MRRRRKERILLTISTERENKMIRVVVDFRGYEKPTVAGVLRSLLSDYRRSYGTISFERDMIKTEGNNNRFYTEFYIRSEDLNRLSSLLKRVA
jgi:hypothetical protein